jgi:hypoxanthine phosphoribosyltransferase
MDLNNIEDYNSFLDEVLISEEEIIQRTKELGAKISKDYAGKDLHLICILRGGVMFLTDLMRNITVPHTIDFMAISSYGVGGRQSSGAVRIKLDLNDDIFERDVILVEDIIDSGHTINKILEMLRTRKPKSLQVCTMLDKAARREVEVQIKYRGFDIEDKFVFGYGLDLDEYHRNLPFVGVVNLEKYTPPE